VFRILGSGVGDDREDQVMIEVIAVSGAVQCLPLRFQTTRLVRPDRFDVTFMGQMRRDDLIARGVV
jgi:hypothetical protein